MTYDAHLHHEKLAELLGSNAPFVVISLIDIRGSAPQIQGAKAIVTENGIVAGTIGGGRVEARAVQFASDLLDGTEGRQCEFVTWNLQNDIGMTCGGEVKLFFEVHVSNSWKIALFGAGHIAQTLVPVLLRLHCQINCIDQREEWLAKLPEHPRLKKTCCENLPEMVAEQPPSSFFVLMTQGHATDLPVLAEVLKTREAPYLGVLGSAQKAKVLRRDLLEMGLSKDKTESFFCPMGLPLGNNTPPEITISIIAQLLQERDRLGVIQHKSKKF